MAQEITDVAYEKLPIDVTVLLDVSASVTGPVLDELGRALRQVRADLAAGDRLRLLTFNMSVRRLVDFAQPASHIDEALASMRGAGSSAVFDGLAVALSASDAPGRRRLIVLFSDGQDSSSISDAETLLDVAQTHHADRRHHPRHRRIRSGPASLLRPSSAARPATVGALTERIASETGGIVVATEAGREPDLEIPPHAAGLPVELRALLHTEWRGARRVAHTLDVRVKRGGADVRARRGYVWR